jgi:hypothetical protein
VPEIKIVPEEIFAHEPISKPAETFIVKEEKINSSPKVIKLPATGNKAIFMILWKWVTALF